MEKKPLPTTLDSEIPPVQDPGSSRRRMGAGCLWARGDTLSHLFARGNSCRTRSRLRKPKNKVVLLKYIADNFLLVQHVGLVDRLACLPQKLGREFLAFNNHGYCTQNKPIDGRMTHKNMTVRMKLHPKQEWTNSPPHG